MIKSLVIRSSVIAGAIYGSHALGVWGTAEDAEKLYKETKEGLCSHLAKAAEISIEVPSIPNKDSKSSSADEFYNQTVKKTFEFLQRLPSYVENIPETVEGAMKGAKDKLVNLENMIPKRSQETSTAKNLNNGEKKKTVLDWIISKKNKRDEADKKKKIAIKTNESKGLSPIKVKGEKLAVAKPLATKSDGVTEPQIKKRAIEK